MGFEGHPWASDGVATTASSSVEMTRKLLVDITPDRMTVGFFERDYRKQSPEAIDTLQPLRGGRRYAPEESFGYPQRVRPRIDAGWPGSCSDLPVFTIWSPSTLRIETSWSMKLPT